MSSLASVSSSVSLVQQPSFVSPIRVVTDEKCWFYELVDVGMDKFIVMSGNEKLATRGLGPCFAICMKGVNKKQIPVLGMCHTSHLVPLEDVLSDLKQAMVDEGCIKRSLETFVIGGQNPSKENSEGNLEEEALVVSLTEKYNVKGTLFNLVETEEESLSVVFTPEGLYVSKRELYESLKGWDNAGTDL